ncbi:gliding motility-associated C-terminal domain-containing protein [Tenacibaculum sp. L6]|uniref:gliding motility-associated C-terminal domain-containing protein n=1 Tax=Tenacibaculum sp. L6 TaxID=2992764 RepID=UPI00237B741A|nr:gliding motility-associated C-terminal domain-containing protein [Tenacibaculum sp. L6]MDE0535413.1 gliding motility-associated C-terminal domain-containing protein [Tenacibaculum sp. L6]
MKKYFYSFFFFGLIINTYSQTAFFNSGNVQLHDGAQVGFHTNVINDGTLDNYTGFAGFYADNEVRTISGTNSVTFFNVEVDALQNLELFNSLGVRNQLDFINGQVITPRNNTNITLDFIDYDFYAGEDDERHVNGYTSLKQGNKNTSDFTFPVGDGAMLRPMSIPNANRYYTFKGAYFYEDPNFPTTFTANFLTDQKQAIIENISQTEFWDLDGNNETQITLTWNSRSDISSLVNQISQLIVVGWSKTENQWVNLDVLEVTGDLSEGTITSAAFVPDNYEAITIGSLMSDEIKDNNNNILISPNGDNLNDFLVFDEVEEYPHNKLVIYNRWGNIVYQTENYKNNWDGTSNGRATINKEDKLPAATYFYYLELGDKPNTYQKHKKGWVYINR